MFSLIYTLGILYLIGLAWAKCKDKIQDKAFKLEQENEEKLKVIFSHVYVLSWKYYQEVEPEVIRFWKQSYAQLYEEHDGFEFYEIAMHLYGRTVHEESIRRALEEMIERKMPIPKRVPKVYNKFIIVDGKSASYDPAKEAAEIYYCRLPALQMQFNHDEAEHAEDPYILSLIPPRRKYKTYHGPNG